MRRTLWAVLALGAVLSGCSSSGAGDAAPPATTAPEPAERQVTTTSTTSPPTTAAPTTAPPATTAPAPPPPAPLDCSVVPARAPLDPARPRYRARLDVDVDAGTASGTVEVDFTPDLALDHLVFRLWANAPRPGPVVGLGVDSVSAAAPHQVVAVEQPDPTTLVARLARPVAAGEVVTVSVAWHQALPWRHEDRVAVGPGWARLGSVVPLLAWEPGVGWSTQPATSGFAEATSSPAADWDLVVTVAPGYEVLATGVPAGEGGAWRAEGARDVAVSIGRFRRASATVAVPTPVEVTVAVAEGVDEDPSSYLATVSDALVAFSERFGPYPFPAYSLAITPDLGGGIEYPGHVMQGPGTGGRTTPHEVAHQWFYGLVGNDQGRDPVLDEGLASYAEFTHLGDPLEAAAWLVPEDAAGRAGAPMSYWEARLDRYYEGVYVQGALAVAAVGPTELVDCALRAYVAEQAWGIATPADLVAALSRAVPGAAAVLAGYGIG